LPAFLVSSLSVLLRRLPFLAACLAGLLLGHAVAVAQEIPGETPSAASEPAPAPAPPAPFKTGRGVVGEGLVFVDSSGALTFDQVRSKFDAGEGQPARQQRIMPTGEGAALWYRLALPEVAAPTPLMLAVPHANMDNVDLYRPSPAAPGGQWLLQRSGDQIAVADWPVRHLTPAFELLLQPGESQLTFLRVGHNNPISVHWVLSEPAEFHDKAKRGHLFLGIYIGLVLLIALFSSLHAVAWRDSIHLFYAVYVLVVALGQLSLTGLGGEFFWPGNAWWNDIAPVVLTMGAATLLHLFLRQLVVDRDMPWLSRGLLVMALVGAIGVLLFLALGRGSIVGRISTPYYLGSMAVYMVVAVWYLWRRPRVGFWILAAMVCLTAGSIFPILRTQGMLPMSFATQYGAQIGAGLEIPLLLLALYMRSRERRDNQARVGALTRMDPLTGVGNHRVLLQRLDSLLLRQQRDPGVGAVVRVRLSNAIELRQEYGMETAQSAVVQAGACITSVAQEGDTVARHRDGDFVLVLQGHLTREQLTDIGQRLIARGLSENPGLPLNTVLQLKVAVAEAPFQATDATLLLQSLGAVLGELAGRSGTALRFVNGVNTADSRAGDLRSATAQA
jgi:GGDEF domain-containing protein